MRSRLYGGRWPASEASSTVSKCAIYQVAFGLVLTKRQLEIDYLLPREIRIAFQMRSGVAGSSMCSMPTLTAHQLSHRICDDGQPWRCANSDRR
jgi:hypothetical protein